ncbi:hypothetical protein BURKHO8Y_110188 [Burkholderia sp. 8Y]|nr:hypothetical protein BURKHO8Y_110188 [Burkholderia sp. 8Y]
MRRAVHIVTVIIHSPSPQVRQTVPAGPAWIVAYPAIIRRQYDNHSYIPRHESRRLFRAASRGKEPLAEP